MHNQQGANGRGNEAPGSSQHQINEQGSGEDVRSASQHGKRRPLRVTILAAVTFAIASLLLTMCLLLVTGREPVPADTLVLPFILIGAYYLVAIALWRSHNWAPGTTLILYTITVVLAFLYRLNGKPYITWGEEIMRAFGILAVPAGIYALSTWLHVRRIRQRSK